MLSDDLPWPELGNVSRGATRGNQGQKGALGPPDADGRAILQLRVQPGVLVVRLNRQASEWYRILDGEVTRALKLTKTYWRKARRRQDYDPRADQDHIELHEWLQQLKDKTMSHLELLMQKGDIQGPPYFMPEGIELTFLRKFIERHNAGIPHNPRLRNGNASDWPTVPKDDSMDSGTPEASESGSVSGADQQLRVASDLSTPLTLPNEMPTHVRGIGASPTPSHGNVEWLVQEAQSSRQILMDARAKLARAQHESQDAFQTYTASLEIERQARHDVHVAEQRRDDLMFTLMSRTRAAHDQMSQRSSVALEDRRVDYQNALPHHIHERRISTGGDMRSNGLSPKPVEWRQPEQLSFYTSDANGIQQQLEDHTSQMQQARKRNWDHAQLQMAQANCEPQEATFLPPRKRVHHLPERLDIQNNSQVLPQDMSFAS